MVVAVETDVEGLLRQYAKKKKSYLDENVQEANGSVGLCDDGIDRRGFGLYTGCCILSALNYVLI